MAICMVGDQTVKHRPQTHKLASYVTVFSELEPRSMLKLWECNYPYLSICHRNSLCRFGVCHCWVSGKCSVSSRLCIYNQGMEVDLLFSQPIKSRSAETQGMACGRCLQRLRFGSAHRVSHGHQSSLPRVVARWADPNGMRMSWCIIFLSWFIGGRVVRLRLIECILFSLVD